MKDWTIQRRSSRVVSIMLSEMEKLGFDAKHVLEKVNVSQSELNDPAGEISFEQELKFFQNILTLAPNRAIGLEFGQLFIPQRYGIFGYAILSATTLRHAFMLGINFGQLTFSFYTFNFKEGPKYTDLLLLNPPPISKDINDMLCDRDIAASVVALNTMYGKEVPLEKIYFTHDSNKLRESYQKLFNCELIFNAEVAKIVLRSDLLDLPLPNSDAQSAEYFHQQCKLLIEKLSNQNQFIDRVRMQILAKPSFFPDIDYVAKKMAMSPRTLRRRLKEEGSSYSEILNEIRYRLSREYLVDTKLPLSEVSRLLGYTESGNFSHAFKRWSGVSPLFYRKNAYQQNIEKNLRVK